MKTIKLIFVVETDDITLSDDAYFTWALKNIYPNYVIKSQCKNFIFDYEFVHMHGKTNYKKPKTLKKIRDIISLFKAAHKNEPVFVIYCFDVDANGNKDTSFIKSVEEFCLSRQYKLIVSYREIESVFNISGDDSKSAKVKRFLDNYPKKTSLNLNNFAIPYKNVFKTNGSTNFKVVVDEIIKSLSQD